MLDEPHGLLLRQRCHGTLLLVAQARHEWTNHTTYDDLEDARLSVFKYIETFYHPVRLHQTLGYRSPNQYKSENAAAQAAQYIYHRNPPFLGHRTR